MRARSAEKFDGLERLWSSCGERWVEDLTPLVGHAGSWARAAQKDCSGAWTVRSWRVLLVAVHPELMTATATSAVHPRGELVVEGDVGENAERSGKQITAAWSLAVG